MLLSFLLAIVPLYAYGGESKKAGRLFLSNGEVAEVFCVGTGSPNGRTATITARFSSGIVVTVSSTIDYIRKHGDTRISDGKTVLEMQDDYGYYSDKLPVPLQVKIGDDVYRVLLKPNTLTDDQKRMQAAVAKLPAPFLMALQQLVPIGGTSQCSIPNLAFMPELFDGTIPKTSIVTVKTLEPTEIDALIRDATK
jgi:hypothetical protein